MRQLGSLCAAAIVASVSPAFAALPLEGVFRYPEAYPSALFMTLAFAVALHVVDRQTTESSRIVRLSALWVTRGLFLISFAAFAVAWFVLPDMGDGTKIKLVDVLDWAARSVPPLIKTLIVLGQIAVIVAVVVIALDAISSLFAREKIDDFTVRPLRAAGAQQDQEKGFVRLMGLHWGQHVFAGRNQLIRISHICADGRRKSIYRIVRFTNEAGFNRDHIAMEYDDSRDLGIQNANGARLMLRRAGPLSYVFYLWDHIDPTIRWQFRMSVVFSLALFVLGIFFGAA